MWHPKLLFDTIAGTAFATFAAIAAIALLSCKLHYGGDYGGCDDEKEDEKEEDATPASGGGPVAPFCKVTFKLADLKTGRVCYHNQEVLDITSHITSPSIAAPSTADPRSAPPYYSVTFRRTFLRDDIYHNHNGTNEYHYYHDLADLAARFHKSFGGGVDEFARALPSLVPAELLHNEQLIGALTVVAHDGKMTCHCFCNSGDRCKPPPFCINAKHMIMAAPFPSNLLHSIQTLTPTLIAVDRPVFVQQHDGKVVAEVAEKGIPGIPGLPMPIDFKD